MNNISNMKVMGKVHIIAACMAAITVSSCAAQKAATTNSKSATTANSTVSADKQALQFVQKVADNALYQQNVVAKMNFNLKSGSKDITVPGSLHMRKDDVIRLQVFVPILGSEIGRMEFTKDYVMIIDRLHKQYIKADYNQVDFLHERGLTFYSLQALFWNQLFIPGTQKVGEEQLSQFEATTDSDASTLPVTLRQGALTFTWQADRNSALISLADITYSSSKHGDTNIKWNYDNFQPFGSKKFPNRQIVNITTAATKQQKEMQLGFELSGVTADSNWEPRTTVSDKYQQVSVEEVIGQLMKL